MRKTALICGLLTILLAAACQSPAAETADLGMEPSTAEAESLEENPAENPEKSLEENPYVSAWFSEELSLTVDGRSFLAEDAPENEAEEAVFREWLTEFLQDPKLYLEDCPESRKGLPEVRNTLENYEQGRYQIQEFVLHELEAVSAEEQAEAEENYLLGREEITEQYGLTESRIVRADWTEEREEPVNYGNGSHSRYYLCGKSEEDPVWRIYAYGIM